MASLVDLSLSTTQIAAGSAVGAVLAAIEGVSPAIAAFEPSEDFSDARNSEYLE